jgi:polyhydroxyalkanoate synthesis repressor PhaR
MKDLTNLIGDLEQTIEGKRKKYEVDESNIRIVKYPNRKLYDTMKKEYVTLGDLESFILTNQRFHVKTFKKEEDVTRNVYIKILSEKLRNNNKFTNKEITDLIKRLEK